jgi:hypothetical protein
MFRTTFALTLLLSFINFAASAPAADPPKETKLRADIVDRLDAIMKRLDDIEQRLANLEATNRMLTEWTVDDRGILRSFDGRPIGHWGIDGPTPQIQKRR